MRDEKPVHQERIQMKGTAIIIAMVHWHFTWQSQHNMAVGLAQHGYRVLYVEPIPKRWPSLHEFNRVIGRLTANSVASGEVKQVLPSEIELITPRLLPDVGPVMQALNRRLFIPGIARNLTRKVIRPLTIINYLPISASLTLMDTLQPDAAIYHCVNDWTNDPYAPDQAIEPDLIAKVDMVWADSPVNFDRTRRLSNKTIRLPHGVNFSHFAKARIENSSVPDRPLCVYFGSIGISTDIDILRKVSHRYPLRLIGPIRVTLDGFSDETEIIGPVSLEELPDLLRDADVLLLPYVHSPHNDSVMPAKLFECLATGKPIVACGLKTLYDYEELFYIREEPEAFLRAIAVAAEEDPGLRYRRIALAEEYSYERRAQKIDHFIQTILAEKS